jgi:uncharacterized protein
MRITGSNVVAAPVAQVWEALLDPQVLVATIPGCERLVASGDHAYDMTVSAGVAAIKGTYSGSCALSDLDDHRSLTMQLRGAGAPGTVDATVDVSFEDLGTEGTRISYDADAVVGGMVGGVGQRMLTSVSKRMAAEFFANVGNSIAQPAPVVEQGGGPAPTGVETPAPAQGAVFARPGVSTSSTAGSADFLRGIAVGAGLVLLGVVAGSLAGRRR